MDRTNYSVERVLQLVRTSFNESLGELSQKVFFQRLWSKLDSLNDPGVVKPPPHQYQTAGRSLVCNGSRGPNQSPKRQQAT